MRTILLGAVALLAVQTTARADDFYLMPFGGVSLVGDQETVATTTPSMGPPNITPVALDERPGYGFGLAAGYAFGIGEGLQLRVEAEVSQRFNTHDSVVTPVQIGEHEGDQSVLAGMANLALAFDVAEGWNLHLGGGVGYARWRYRSDGGGGPVLIGARENSFAYQGFAGIDYEVTTGFHVGVQYRYFALLDQDLNFDATALIGVPATAEFADMSYHSHDIMVTGRIDMGPLLRAFGVR